MKREFISFESGRITDANYIFVTRVGDRENGNIPSLTNSGDGFLLAEDFDGNRIVIDCRSFPKAKNHEETVTHFTDMGMGPDEILDELFANGLGRSIDFTENAYIRVIGPDGVAMPYVFTDYDDAVEFLESEKAEA